ncbi:MAG: PQQ-binding-like beta-propeller repeat protein [Novosphingobium sp.]|nr:PQQ-binding-like beta-propeller repeat protein [Novosphingobium sp.]
MKSRYLLALAAIASFSLAGCNLSGAGSEKADEPKASASPDEWHNFGNGGDERHYSPLDQINTDTVPKLKLAWFADLPQGNSATGPVMAEGKVFVTTGHGHVRAFDAVTGQALWDYDSHAREASKGVQLRLGWGPKGLAYENGRVFLGTHDGRVIALNATDGKLLWEQREFPAGDMRYINGPVRVFGGKVIVGHGGADFTPLRAYVTAYDAASGKRLWRFYTVPGEEPNAGGAKADGLMKASWPGGWTNPDGSRRGGGGTAWNAFSYDPDLDLIYIGVGNGFPYNQSVRSPAGGDNLFLSSIVAVRARTGKYVWHYQVCPAEQWDCTATQDMSLATLEIGGKPRKVLIQAPKNGFVYVLDRASGELLSTGQYADKVTWAERIDEKTGRPVENPGLRYHGKPGQFELWPGVRGAHSWLPQSFSPRTGLVYIPVIEGASLIGDEGLDLDNLPPALGSGVVMDPDPERPEARKSFLKAWDPVTQKERWRVELPGNWPGGVLSTAGDLVFQGRLDGYLVAYDARDGKELWRFATGAPVVAPPISYRVGETQYVTVLTGNGAGGGGLFSSGNSKVLADYFMPRRVLTFALAGKAKLPPNDTSAIRPPLRDPGFVPDPALAEAGGRAFGQCMVCHGFNALGAGSAPDLRTSPLILDADAFRQVVKEGALVPAGMPAFPEIDDTTLEAIRHYLRVRAMENRTSK